MIIRRELKSLAKEKGLSLSKEFINELDKKLKEDINLLINQCAMISRHAGRKTLNIEDLKLLIKLK